MTKANDDNFFDSLKDGISRRFNDPIVSTFTISFLITNYEIMIWLLSDSTTEIKIAQINALICNYWSWLIPLVVTILLLALPFLAYKIYEKVELGKVLLKNARSIAEKKLISVELELQLAERRIKEEIERTNEAQNTVAKKSEEVGALNKTIADLRDDISSLKKKNNSDSKQSFSEENPEIIKCVKLLSAKNLSDSFRLIAADSTVNIAWASEYDQDDIVALKTIGLLKVEENQNGRKYLNLTELGDKVYKASL